MKKIKEIGLRVLALIWVIMIYGGFSWLIICAGMKLITMLFGWPFHWCVATAIWIIVCIIQIIFKE